MAGDLFNPTDEHRALRHLVRDFTEREVDPQAAQHDRDERFNVPLFRRLGDLGLLGITVPAQYGGAGMDATAAVIAAWMRALGWVRTRKAIPASA